LLAFTGPVLLLVRGEMASASDCA